MTAYYNEIDPHAAQWLRNLIAAGHIADGEVDERSIVDVTAGDLRGFVQCHFFAGIGVWSYALRKARWPDSVPVWTGSCPCQPFSLAGDKRGFDDERHLWPDFHRLIRDCAPAVVFGEQVASKSADPWVDLVQSDLETLGYAFGAVPFTASAVGAPHHRERLYWVAADADRKPQLSVQHCGSPQGSPTLASDWQVDFVDFDFGDRVGRKRIPQPPCGWLDDGPTAGVGRLRAYGNAIVSDQAAEFIAAFVGFSQSLDLVV